MSQLGKFLNLHPHMQSWAVYNENGPYTSASKIGTLSPAQFGGLSYMILAEKGGDVYVIQTESFGKCAIWAPVDNDSNIAYERTYSNGDNNGSGGGTVVPGTGKYLNLHSHMQSWAVYNENGPYTSANKIGSLAPSQFGGLSYSILEEKGGNVYIIQTDSFGRCAIWAPRDNDSSITTSPSYSNGNTSGGGIISGNGKYLNLHAHMTSWAVYNVNGPYTSAYKIGSLAPSQFGGLSYSILEEKGGNVYIIQTDSFGRCAIWAPRDNDSSITTSPSYSNGNISGGGTTPGGGGGGVIIPGGLKVFIDPGHGGSDPGAIGNGLNEKDIVLSISKKLGVLLNAKGVSVEYSRTTDVAVSLEGRPEKANNWGANLFVSIHSNAFDSSARGTECYTTPSADSKSKQLSANISKAISSKLGIPNRGHKEEIWRVLRLSNMPAILIETAFIDNSSDANLLKTRQDDFANEIANQILNYLEVSTPNPPKTLAQLMSETGFAKHFGVSLTALPETITIVSAPGVTVKLSVNLSASVPGNIVADFSGGTLSDLAYKNQIGNINMALSKKGLSMSKHFASIGSNKFTVSVTSNGVITTVKLTMATPITGYGSANQVLIFEFDETKLKALTVAERQTVYSKVNDKGNFLAACFGAVLIGTLVYFGAGPILAIGGKLVGLAEAFWLLLLGLLS
jgi:N-acetylmuramoyl-L-alanine amidase